MIQKLIVIVLAFLGTGIIQWYGNFVSKLPSKGTYLGLTYNSPIIRALITQFEYLWVIILANFLFTLMFKLGMPAFKGNFLSLAIVWIGMGPIVAFLYSTLILKEKATVFAGIGLLLIIVGGILVVAQNEIVKLLK